MNQLGRCAEDLGESGVGVLGGELFEEEGQMRIVDLILKNVVVRSKKDLGVMEVEKYVLTYGNREYRVTDYGDFFGGYMDTICGKEGALVGQTTYLMKAALELMKKICKEKEKDMRFVYDTFVASMIGWAETKGRDVFAWEDIQEYVDDDGDLCRCYRTMIRAEVLAVELIDLPGEESGETNPDGVRP